MYNCIQKQIKFPLLLLLLLTQEVYYYENTFMFAEILKYCLFFCRRQLIGKNDGGGKDFQREFIEIPSVHCSTVNVLQNSKISPPERNRCFSHACRLPHRCCHSNLSTRNWYFSDYPSFAMGKRSVFSCGQFCITVYFLSKCQYQRNVDTKKLLQIFH